ncbi:GNAT family N-acetyltransferase [Croceibacterium selenioxidans]|uniref:GNAT family N-acetyltransferase n=1 Tax=Croceibacterium selenioxidans TaxID=2838833 RepID=UPI0030842015
MTAVSYHDTVNDLQGLALTSRDPFARPEWFTLLERGGARPLIALARDGRDAVALALTRGSHGLENLSNWYAFTWSELAADGTSRAPLLERLARDLAPKARCVILSKLADEDGTATRLERAFRNAGWFVKRERCDWNHGLPVNGRSYAQYLAERPGHLRTTLKRKAKRVEVSLSTLFQDDIWNSYEAVYAHSWKPIEGDPALLRRFAEAESKAGRLRLGLASYEGEVVAAQMWTVDHGTAYIHKLAHLESAKPLSAGTTLTAALFEHVIDCDGVEWVDFGTGDDPYKRDWMEEVRPRYRLTCWRVGHPRNWPAIGKSLLRQLVSRPSPL